MKEALSKLTEEQKTQLFEQTKLWASKNMPLAQVTNVRQVKARKRVNIAMLHQRPDDIDYKEAFESLRRVVKKSRNEHQICVCIGCNKISGSDDCTGAPWSSCHRCDGDLCSECVTKALPEPPKKEEFLSVHYCYACKDEQSDTELEHDHEEVEVRCMRYSL